MSRKLKSIAELGKEILDEVKYNGLSKTSFSVKLIIWGIYGYIWMRLGCLWVFTSKYLYICPYISLYRFYVI